MVHKLSTGVGGRRGELYITTPVENFIFKLFPGSDRSLLLDPFPLTRTLILQLWALRPY